MKQFNILLNNSAIVGSISAISLERANEMLNESIKHNNVFPISLDEEFSFDYNLTKEQKESCTITECADLTFDEYFK